MATVKELQTERGQCEHKMREIVDLAEKEDRDLNAEENTKFDELHKRDVELKKRIERQDRLDSVKSELDEQRNHGIDRDEVPASAAGEMPDEPEEQRDQKPLPDDDCRAIQAWLRRGQSLPLDGVAKTACHRQRFNPANRRQIIQAIDKRVFRRLIFLPGCSPPLARSCHMPYNQTQRG